MKRKYAWIVLCICVAGIFIIFLFFPRPGGVTGPSLDQYQQFRLNNVTIILGEHATPIEYEAGQIIINHVSGTPQNESLIIKRSTDLSVHEKDSNNLIILGTSQTNTFIDRFYGMNNISFQSWTGGTPRNGTLLQVFPNPWNSDRCAIVVTGDVPQAVLQGVSLLNGLQPDKNRAIDTIILGRMEQMFISMAPAFDDCIQPAPDIPVDNKYFYLKNLCQFPDLLGDRRTLFQRQVMIKGRMTEMESLMGVKGQSYPREVKIEYKNVIEVSEVQPV